MANLPPLDISKFKLGNQQSGLTFDQSRTTLGASSTARNTAFKSNGNTWNQGTPLSQILNNFKIGPTGTSPAGQAQKGQALIDQGNQDLQPGNLAASTAKGTLSSIASGFAKPFARIGATVGDVITRTVGIGQSLFGNKKGAAETGQKATQVEQQGVDMGILGNVKPIQGIGDAIGTGVEGGLNISGAEDIPELVAKIPGVSAATSAIAGVGKDALSDLSDAAKTAGTTIAKTALGKDTMSILTKLSGDAKDFIPTEFGGSGKTLGDVATKVDGAIDTFVKSSKDALQQVKQSIPQVEVGMDAITQKAGQAVSDALNATSKYKGIAISSFDDVKDLINKGAIKPEEAEIAKKMSDTISNWTDTSARGILNLKETLSNFYEDGAQTSNKILSNIQNGLKDLVEEAAPGIKGALKTASENIDTAGQFTKNLLGKDTISGESKLKSIANALGDPALNSEKLKLIQQLKSATGVDIQPELKGFSDFESLLKKYGSDASQIPSKTKAVLSAIVKRGTAAGIGGAAIKGIYDILK